MERLKIRRELQESKKRAAETEKEAERGSLNAAGDDGDTSAQQNKPEDAETTEGSSSQGKNDRVAVKMWSVCLFKHVLGEGVWTYTPILS